MDRTEKRDHARVSGSFDVRFRVEGRTAAGVARDLSAGGMLLVTAMPIDPGQELTIELHLPNYPAMELAGRVVELRRGGAGVRFDAVTPRQRSFLEAFAAVLLAEPAEEEDGPA